MHIIFREEIKLEITPPNIFNIHKSTRVIYKDLADNQMEKDKIGDSWRTDIS